MRSVNQENQNSEIQMNTYPGIDYSGNSLANQNIATGIHFGVISCHSLMPEAIHQNQEFDYGTPEEAVDCPECDHCFHPPHASKWGDILACPNCGEEFELEIPDMAEPCGWSIESDGCRVVNCLDNDAMILESPYFTYAAYCSPCCPGAGNLDNPFPTDDPWTPFEEPSDAPYWAQHAESHGFPKVYALSHDWFEGGKAPYPVFSVETGELAQPNP